MPGKTQQCTASPRQEELKSKIQGENNHQREWMREREVHPCPSATEKSEDPMLTNPWQEVIRRIYFRNFSGTGHKYLHEWPSEVTQQVCKQELEMGLQHAIFSGPQEVVLFSPWPANDLNNWLFSSSIPTSWPMTSTWWRQSSAVPYLWIRRQRSQTVLCENKWVPKDRCGFILTEL